MKFFEDAKESNYIETPFVDEYVKNNVIDDTPHLVTEIIKTRKGSGYLIKTDSFLIFLYNKSALLQQLLEALQVYVKDQHGYQIFAVLQAKEPYYKLGMDENKHTNWFLTLGKYTQSADITSDLEKSLTSNPFLPSTQSKRTRK